MSSNIIDPSTILDALFEWCDTETSGITWIFTNQGGVRPREPYGTIGITTTSQLGHASYSQDDFIDEDDAPLKMRINTFNILNVAINIFGNTSSLEANRLLFSVNKISTTDLFSIKKLGFQSTSELRDISGLENKGSQQRRQFDAVFNVLGDLVEEIHVIESVELHNEIDGTVTIITTTPEVAEDWTDENLETWTDENLETWTTA